jgi:hypothetical protein
VNKKLFVTDKVGRRVVSSKLVGSWSLLDHTFGTCNYWLVAPSLGIAIAPSHATVDLTETEDGRDTMFIIRLSRETTCASMQERVAA